MNTTITSRLALLRTEMKARGIDAVIIPQADPHQSEYLAQHWQVRRYLSGFNGSAGTLVVTSAEAALWTDSRYFLQATRQLEGTGIKLMKDGLTGTPSITAWLMEILDSGAKIGIDGWLFPVWEVDDMIDSFKNIDVKLITDFDIVDQLWPDRPALPGHPAFIHEEQYAGESAASKLNRIRMTFAGRAVQAIWISALDEIAWLLNLRGSDVRCNPVNTCYLFITPEKGTLFIDPSKIEGEVGAYLKDNGIDVYPYQNVTQFINKLPAGLGVIVDEATSSYGLCQALGESRCVLGNSPVPAMKAIKNNVQIDGFRSAMRKDGVALVKSFMEIENRLQDGIVTTELDVSDILRKHRAAQPLFFDESFETIAGYGPHGAIVHYSATPDTNVDLQPTGLLLVDSGAQYFDGTTDITRTIALGQPAPDEKRDFTLTLKGMINMAMAVFPSGTRGIQLDTLAHIYQWRAGKNYLHGTGHGIGHFLNVHEGPFSVRNNGRNWDIPLEPGMILSDEPGLYAEGLHGIRCENLLLVEPRYIEGQDDFTYLGFETLTLFPFDLSLIDMSIMNPDEIQWLNAYHKRVYDQLSPLLDLKEQQWLKYKTQTL